MGNAMKDEQDDRALSELKDLLSPLRGVEPPAGQRVRWREYQRELRAFPARFNRRLAAVPARTWAWLLAGNLAAIAVLALFLPVGEVSRRGHILSFEVNASSRDAKGALAKLPWLRGAAYGISRQTNRNEPHDRTRLHLVLVDKQEAEVARWAEDLLATPSILKLKIIPVMVEDRRIVAESLFESITGRMPGSEAARQRRLEHRVSQHLKTLSGDLPLTLGSNQLVADTFDASPMPASLLQNASYE